LVCHWAGLAHALWDTEGWQHWISLLQCVVLFLTLHLDTLMFHCLFPMECWALRCQASGNCWSNIQASLCHVVVVVDRALLLRCQVVLPWAPSCWSCGG
jgi:hypothetical protein